MTSTATAPAPAGYDDGRVLIGHAAATGGPVDYTARSQTRAYNGLITGGTDVGKTTLAERIADTLDNSGDWTITRVAAAVHVDRIQAIQALDQAEHRAGQGQRGARLHLVIWDDFHRLAVDRYLQDQNFADRVTTLAEHGPEYGVAQLVITPSLMAVDFGNRTWLRGLLADNLVALRSSNRSEQARIGGATIAPSTLPTGRGHAYVLVPAAGGGDFVHAHLDNGRPASDCDPCWRAANAQLAESTPPALAWDPQSGFAARRDERGQWRWLDYQPGAALSDRQIADLVAYQAGVQVVIR